MVFNRVGGTVRETRCPSFASAFFRSQQLFVLGNHNLIERHNRIIYANIKYRVNRIIVTRQFVPWSRVDDSIKCDAAQVHQASEETHRAGPSANGWRKMEKKKSSSDV